MNPGPRERLNFNFTPSKATHMRIRTFHVKRGSVPFEWSQLMLETPKLWSLWNLKFGLKNPFLGRTTWPRVRMVAQPEVGESVVHFSCGQNTPKTDRHLFADSNKPGEKKTRLLQGHGEFHWAEPFSWPQTHRYEDNEPHILNTQLYLPFFSQGST